jgi:molybdopterin converting factor small subunit
MRVRVKLMASLRNKLPPDAAGGTAHLEVEPGTTVATVLDRLGVPSGHVHLVMVNGSMERDRQRALAEGDELVVFPPVAGGELRPGGFP